MPIMSTQHPRVPLSCFSFWIPWSSIWLCTTNGSILDWQTLFWNAQKPIWVSPLEFDLITDHFVLDRCAKMESTMMILTHQLIQINRITFAFTKQTCTIVLVFYYVVFLSIDGGVFIIIDKRTGPILRFLSSLTCSFIFSMVFAAFALFATLNGVPRRLLPNLEHCIHRIRFKRSITFRLIELQMQIKRNKIGMSCHGIFTFTTRKIFFVLLSIGFNFFLIFSLFQEHFR